MVKWGAEKAAKMPGGINSDNMKASLEAIGTATDYPSSYSLVLGNPRWSKADHTTAGVDYTKLWGLVRPSTPVDGIYDGELLNFT